MLLISKTSAVTFLVIKLVKNVAEKMVIIVEKFAFTDYNLFILNSTMLMVLNAYL